MVRALDFNEEVCLDTLVLYDQEGKRIEALSVIDMATGYHVVKKLYGKKSTDMLKCFVDAWVMWAGPPTTLTVDQERGFIKEFVDGLEELGMTLRFTAGQAHWQQGAVERQGQWYRTIWDKTVEHCTPKDEEMEYVMASVAAAKNNLRREHGYSPAQWLFGSEPRTGDAMLDENEKLYYRDTLQTPDETWLRKQLIRQSAREAFMKSQAEAATKRALLGRPRTRMTYEPGDYVYLFRVNKTTGGRARHRQNVGEWIGPGVVVAKEGASYWVSRGGRCLLCAVEHLRPAESEEVGAVFQSRVLKEDLAKLVENMEVDDMDEPVMLDATGAPGVTRQWVGTDEYPERRLRAKGQVRMLKRSAPDGGETQLHREQPGGADRSGSDAEDPSAPSGRPHQVLMTERRAPKAVMIQNDKEIKWKDIPEGEKDLYKKAEETQWNQHIQYNAVKVYYPDDAELIRKKVPKDRILSARFAYRDKNVAKRRICPETPAKAKARLCVGGHRDPDLEKGALNTEAPTASKTALTTLLFLAAHGSWRIAAGDVEAAFLNGVEARRGLYFEPPVQDLPGVPPGSIIEIIKGVFGLSTSPRLWWDKLTEELRELVIEIGGCRLHMEHHQLDPCFLLLRDEGGNLRGAMVTHVDDLLIAAPEAELQGWMEGLSGIFPIAEWEVDEFEYTGSMITQAEGKITFGQESYVDSRLEVVELPRGCDPEELADEVTKQDNMSTIGALSWLASQSRPDIQAAVSLSQRKQRGPTYQDVKETNKAAKMAQAGKGERLCYEKLADDIQDLVIVVFHDAAWANATMDPERDCPEDVEAASGHGIYSQIGHLVMVAHKSVLLARGDW